MANIDNPHGFKPIGVIRRANKYDIDSSNTPTISINDLATKETDGNITRLSSEDFVLGSVIALRDADGKPTNHIATLTAGEAIVADHPDQQFEAQVNGTWTKISEGANFNITDAAGDATLGTSNQEIDFSSIGNASALQVKVLRLHNMPVGNVVGADANVVCIINQHQLGHGDGSTGLN